MLHNCSAIIIYEKADQKSEIVLEWQLHRMNFPCAIDRALVISKAK